MHGFRKLQGTLKVAGFLKVAKEIKSLMGESRRPEGKLKVKVFFESCSKNEVNLFESRRKN